MNRKLAVSGLVLVTVIVAALIGWAARPQVTQAAFNGPMANAGVAPDRTAYLFSPVDATQTATGTYLSRAYAAPWSSRADYQIRVRADVSNTANSTLTVQLMFSNDTSTGAAPTSASAWVPGPVILATTGYAAGADSTDMTQTLNIGYWTAISYTLANAQQTRVTVYGLYK